MSKLKRKKAKTDFLVVLLDLIIAIMVFVILISAFNLYLCWDFANNSAGLSQDADMLSYELQNNDYASLIQGKYINDFNNKKEAKSYHALADYVEAASKYKVYLDKGYTNRADDERKIMDDARSRMDKLTIFADKVDKLFL